MLREIRKLGFEFAELSHGIRISLVPGILKTVDNGETKISSLHNFCPLPLGVMQAAPNLFEFSASDERDRELAFKHTLKTLDFAERVKAPLVVLHLGSIPMKDYTGTLCAMLQNGERNSPKYERLRREALIARDVKHKKFYARTKESLRRLLPEAIKRGIKLCCENRQMLEELPLENDIAGLLLEFANPNLVYWHDTGHAQIKENLGFINHTDFLQSLAPRLAGFHVHDVQFPAADHAAPGAGAVDFAALRTFVKPGHVKVFELNPSLPADAVKSGIAHLKKLWGEEL